MAGGGAADHSAVGPEDEPASFPSFGGLPATGSFSGLKLDCGSSERRLFDSVFF